MSWFRNLPRRPTPRDGFVNSTQDEQDLTNFRVLTDYVTSLLQSWISSGRELFQRLMIWLGLLAYFKKRPKRCSPRRDTGSWTNVFYAGAPMIRSPTHLQSTKYANEWGTRQSLDGAPSRLFEKR